MSFLKNIGKIFGKSKDNEVKKYEKALSKTRNEFVIRLNFLGVKYTKIDNALFQELEEILIMSDIGVMTAINLTEKLKKRVKEEKIENFEYLKEIIVDELLLIYVNGEILSSTINFNKNGKTVVLFVGVNGVGKTTSIAKLAKKMKDNGKTVLLIAADTFRAGAVEQLKIWAEKLCVEFYGKENSDPASVVYDGLNYAILKDIDVVLIDTAGRLHNKINLMKELEKINKVISNIIPDAPNETLLVIDATTGQNAVEQAKNFKEIVNLTGIILTKLDGTAKGAIVLAVKETTGIPVKFVGLGEKEDDMIPFDIEKYIYGLFKDWN